MMAFIRSTSSFLLAAVLLLGQVHCEQKKPVQKEGTKADASRGQELFQEPSNSREDGEDSGDSGAKEPKPHEPDSISQLPCEELSKHWKAFARQHKSCKVKEDCFISGTFGSCDCLVSLGKFGGDAISISAQLKADDFDRRARSCRRQGKMFCLPDAMATQEADCISGICTEIVDNKQKCF